jgi:hypothetical protein
VPTYLCATPLPFNDPSLSLLINLKQLIGHLEKCEIIYPDVLSNARSLLENLEQLLHLFTNPLFDTFSAIIKQNKWYKTALLLKESRLIPSLEELLSKCHIRANIKIIVPQQLRGLESYDRLIMIGSPYWFPEYILTAPRASTIEIVHYCWIGRKWKQKPVFLGSLTSPLLKLTSEGNNNSENVKLNLEKENSLNVIEPEKIFLPTINWDALTKKNPVLKLNTNDVDSENVPAKLLLLERNTSAIFLGRESKAFVIDLYGEVDELQKDSNSKVKKLKVTELKPDLLILLKTGGGGDYIIPVADRILKQSGEDVEKFRDLQKEWKNLLKIAVRRNSLQTVSQDLVKLGSHLAKHEINIRNWMSSVSIGPREDKDFEAILQYLDLGKRINEFKNAVDLIRHAHQQAGHHIRKLLLQKVSQADLTKLEQMGVMEFELEQADGVSMTAWRVVDIDSKLHEVPASEIGQVFEIKEYFQYG